MYTDGSGATPTRPSSLSKSSSLNWLMGWFGARWLSLLAPAVSIKPFFFNLVFTQREIGKRCRSGADVAGPVGRRLGPPAVLSHPAPYDSCHALSISPVSSWSGDRSGPSISTASQSHGGYVTVLPRSVTVQAGAGRMASVLSANQPTDSPLRRLAGVPLTFSLVLFRCC